MDVISYCNEVSRTCGDRRGPILSNPPSVEEIRNWLQWNDRDGEWDFLKSADDESALDVLIHVCGGSPECF